jgi:hypothetical protein
MSKPTAAASVDEKEPVKEGIAAVSDKEHPFLHYYGLLIHQQNMLQVRPSEAGLGLLVERCGQSISEGLEGEGKVWSCTRSNESCWPPTLLKRVHHPIKHTRGHNWSDRRGVPRSVQKAHVKALSPYCCVPYVTPFSSRIPFAQARIATPSRRTASISLAKWCSMWEQAAVSWQPLQVGERV